MKKLLAILAALFITAFAFFNVVQAAPTTQLVYQATILPLSTNKYDLGTSTNYWRNFYVSQICLVGDTCRTTWPTGGGGNTFAYPFPSNATTTIITFSNGIIGNASTATALQTGRDINGVLFDGTSNILINAASSTLLSDSNTFGGTQRFTNAPIFSSLTGVLKGNGASALTVAANGTDYTLITAKTCTLGDFVSAVTAGGVFTCTTPTGGGGNSFAYPFPSNATTTILTLSGGALISTSTIGNLSATSTFTLPLITSKVLSTDANGLVYGTATSTPTVTAPITYSGTLGQFINGVSGAFGCTNASAGVTGCLTGTDWSTFNNKQAALTATWPQVLTGSTLTFGGLSTSTPAVVGNIPYFSGVNTFANVATGTASCSTGASCTSFTVIGSSPTITTTLGTSVDLASEVTGRLPFANLTQGAANTVLVNQTSATADFAALATSTFANGLYTGAAGQVLARLSNGTWTGVATSTDSCSTGITCTYAGGTNSFSIANSAVTNAMLANSTISTVALGGTLAALTAGTTLTSGGTYTGATGRTFDIDLTHANSWTGLQQFANASSTLFSVVTKAYFGATATTTIDSIGSITTPANSKLTLGTTTAGTLKTNSSGLVYADTASAAGSTITPYFSTNASYAAVAVPVVANDVVQWWGMGSTQNNSCAGSNHTAAFAYRHSTYAATTSLEKSALNTGGGTAGCTMTDFYQLTATTTETIYFEVINDSSNLSEVRSMAQKIH